MNVVTDFIKGMDPWVILLAVIVISILAVTITAHRCSKSKAKLLDLVVGPDGKLSNVKITGIIGFIVSSWIVVKMTAAGQMSLDIFLAYAALTNGLYAWYMKLRANGGAFKEPKNESGID